MFTDAASEISSWLDCFSSHLTMLGNAVPDKEKKIKIHVTNDTLKMKKN